MSSSESEISRVWLELGSDSCSVGLLQEVQFLRRREWSTALTAAFSGCFYFLGNRWQGVTAVDTGDAGVADGKQTWSNDQDPECGKSVETGLGNMSLW